MKILIINGPNLNMLGIREPEIYGRRDYAALCETIEKACAGIDCEIYQSNHEGDIIDKIQSALHTADAIVINPAAYTHTSIGIPDALKAVALPVVEVHLSDISARESFRRISYVSDCAERTISGKGFDGYTEAIRYLRDKYE